MYHFLKIFFLLALVTAASASPDTIQIGSFAESGLTGWSEKSFKGATEYLVVEDAGQKVLQAKSQNAASGLIFETEYDPMEYPILTWRWKIGNTIANGDSRTKAGDDYAARIYVVFPHWFFLKTKTLNYIWANRLPKDATQLSPFTSNDMMIALESGPGKAGQWVSATCNIVEDYRRAFGEDPPDVGMIAIMTDTDGTGESAIAWYSDIVASSLSDHQ
jgi:hypothetical protein